MSLIYIIHVILFIIGVIVPFTNNMRLLMMYSIVIPFLFWHWAVNDDTCALTQLEVFVTGKKKEHTFFGRLLGPIFKLSDTTLAKLSKTLFFLLWLVTYFKILYT